MHHPKSIFWGGLDFYAQLTILILKDTEVTGLQRIAKVILTGGQKWKITDSCE